MRRTFIMAAALAALAIPALAQTDTSTAIDEIVEPFVLSPGDVIDVQVLEDNSLNRQLLIQPDGKISFPLAGVLDAGGKTPEQLQAIVRAALSDDFLDAPTVTVALVASQEIVRLQERRPTVFVLGQVRSPGVFPLGDGLSVVQILALAGGPAPFAATSRIQIRSRDDSGTESVTFFDYEELERGRRLPNIPPLSDGDVIFIPERGLFE
ncbi:MAG: polysaccharide biosynthesis/export family protein [Pseudomonadota bacterium]